MTEELKQARNKLRKLREQQEFNNSLYLNDSDLEQDIKALKQEIAKMESGK